MSADLDTIAGIAADICDDCDRLAERVRAVDMARYAAERTATKLRVDVSELEREKQWLRRRLDAADARHAAELDAAHAEIRRLRAELAQATRKRRPWHPTRAGGGL